MAVLFFPVLVIKRDFLDVLKENWWRYIILGAIDVEANFLVVLAYKYTTLTSIQVRVSMHLMCTHLLVVGYYWQHLICYLLTHYISLSLSLSLSLGLAFGQLYDSDCSCPLVYFPESPIFNHSFYGRGYVPCWYNIASIG